MGALDAAWNPPGSAAYSRVCGANGHRIQWIYAPRAEQSREKEKRRKQTKFHTNIFKTISNTQVKLAAFLFRLLLHSLPADIQCLFRPSASSARRVAWDVAYWQLFHLLHRRMNRKKSQFNSLNFQFARNHRIGCISMMCNSYCDWICNFISLLSCRHISSFFPLLSLLCWYGCLVIDRIYRTHIHIIWDNRKEETAKKRDNFSAD